MKLLQRRRRHKNYQKLEPLVDQEQETQSAKPAAERSTPKKRHLWTCFFHRRHKFTLGPVADTPEQPADTVVKNTR